MWGQQYAYNLVSKCGDDKTFGLQKWWGLVNVRDVDMIPHCYGSTNTVLSRKW